MGKTAFTEIKTELLTLKVNSNTKKIATIRGVQKDEERKKTWITDFYYNIYHF